MDKFPVLRIASIYMAEPVSLEEEVASMDMAAKMTDAQNRGLKLAYFVLGIAVPFAGYLFWSRTDGFRLGQRKQHVDAAHDVTVEDSFPASDPPSAW